MPKKPTPGPRVTTRSSSSNAVSNDQSKPAFPDAVHIRDTMLMSDSSVAGNALVTEAIPDREQTHNYVANHTTGDKLTSHEEKMKVLEALDLNQSMQQEIMKQISWIEDNITLNLQYMYEVRAMRWKEQRIKRSKLNTFHPIHKLPHFFNDEAGESPPTPKTPYESSSWQAYRYRPWTHTERHKLVEAIRMEAKRLMALDYHASGHHHLIWDVEKVSDERLEVYSVDRIDWKRVSKIYVPHRTPTECMIQWTTQEHPKINKTPWSVAENRKLIDLVLKHGVYGNWEKIAVELGTDRTVSQCFSHYQSQAARQKARRRWTKTEDRLLKLVIKSLGPRNWQQIAHIIGDRTGSQCLQRWTKALDPAIRRSRWVPREDHVLKNAVQVYGLGNWRLVQKHIPGRTDMQCRERWVNVLDPDLKHSKFESEEMEKLHRMVNEHGPKWSMLAQHFPGRTDNQLLRAWRTHILDIEKGLCVLEQSGTTTYHDDEQLDHSELGFPSESTPNTLGVDEETSTPSTSKKTSRKPTQAKSKRGGIGKRGRKT